MTVHTPVEKPGIYFITFTCYRWLHLIGKTGAYEAVYNFFSIPLPLFMCLAQAAQSLQGAAAFQPEQDCLNLKGKQRSSGQYNLI